MPICPFWQRALLPPDRARVQSGQADMDVSALYAPPAGTPLAAIDLNALDMHGTLQADNLFLTAPQLEGPLENVASEWHVHRR